MLNIEATMTIGALARQYPNLLPVFFEKGLDFCCGGNRTLADLCRAHRIDAETLLADLNAAHQRNQHGPVPGWEDGQIEPLIHFILNRFHQGHRQDFQTLPAMMKKVVKVHGDRLNILYELEDIVYELINDIEPHMQKEEEILFPMLLAKAGDPAVTFSVCAAGPAGPIRVMRMEHEAVGKLLDRLVEITCRFTPPDWACRTLIALFEQLKHLDTEIRLHVHMENNVLFPMALDTVEA